MHPGTWRRGGSSVWRRGRGSEGRRVEDRGDQAQLSPSNQEETCENVMCDLSENTSVVVNVPLHGLKNVCNEAIRKE